MQATFELPGAMLNCGQSNMMTVAAINGCGASPDVTANVTGPPCSKWQGLVDKEDTHTQAAIKQTVIFTHKCNVFVHGPLVSLAIQRFSAHNSHACLHLSTLLALFSAPCHDPLQLPAALSHAQVSSSPCTY